MKLVLVFAAVVTAFSYFGAVLTELDSWNQVDQVPESSVYQVGDTFLAPLVNSSAYYLFTAAARIVDYDGYIPVSSCHSVRYSNFEGGFTVSRDKGQQVVVDTAITGSGNVNSNCLALLTVKFGMDLKVGVAVGATNSRGLDFSCQLKPGQTGQAFARPKFLEISTHGVVGQLSDLVRETVKPATEFIQWKYPIENIGTVTCVTDDQVQSLACDRKPNYVDVNDPIQLVWR